MKKPSTTSTPTASAFPNPGAREGTLPTSASPLKKRSLILAGHATSLALEAAFWRGLERWAAEEHRALSDLVAEIDAARTEGSLASAVRVTLFLRAEAAAEPNRQS